MTPPKCDKCGQSCSWLTKAERWRCHVCPRWVDAPPPKKHESEDVEPFCEFTGPMESTQ